MARGSRNGRPGRPGRPKTGETKAYYEGRLHEFLIDKLPEAFVHYGRVDMGALAVRANRTRQTISLWFLNDHISVSGAKCIVEICEGRVKLDDLLTFIAS